MCVRADGTLRSPGLRVPFESIHGRVLLFGRLDAYRQAWRFAPPQTWPIFVGNMQLRASAFVFFARMGEFIVDMDREQMRYQATTRAARRRHEVDLVILELLRLVSDESWNPRRAAGTLRRRVPDESVLRGARRRVVRALAERPSQVAHRAAVTLDAALDGPSIGRPLGLVATH